MKLFEPGKIGKLTIKNRIVMAALANRLAEFDGRLSQRAIDYYAARARGGTGLIITGSARVSRLIEQLPIAPLCDYPMVDSRIYVSQMSVLADAVHDYGAKIAIQLQVGQGRNIRADVLKTVGAVAPSPVPATGNPKIIARALKIEEIEQLVRETGFGAEVVKGAGIDALELNCHSGYLVDEFMTSFWNKRTDKYGGDLDGRLRFLMELVGAMRQAVGPGFPIIVKYPLTHYFKGGREIEEGLEIARKLEAAGVDALDIDSGSYETLYWTLPPTTQPPGCNLDLAEKVKKVVKIPVISVGRLQYPEVAEQALQEGKADFISIGKGLVAEPEWANKVQQGRLDDLKPCIGCHTCHDRTRAGNYIGCAVNPATGAEREMELYPAAIEKSVVVVGGGPAGMEAARVAALRGHKVTLFEKNFALGGSLIPASVPDFKHDYRDLINYLSTQVKKLGVEVKLATEATPEAILEIAPDVVFLATGGAPITPDIKGIKNKKVVTAVDLLLGKNKVGESVVVIGGGAIGGETALYLAQQGKKVTIVEILSSVMQDMAGANRSHIIKLLADANATILTETKVLEIKGEGVVIADKNNKQSTLKADTVVLAVGMSCCEAPYEELKSIVPEVYVIGDCVETRKVADAIKEAYRIARLI